MIRTCKHCRRDVSIPHHCSVARKTIRESDEGDFVLSAIIGAATDSAILGALFGGDLIGGVVGDLLGDGDLFD
jgi:hypothetical protein